MGSSLQVSDPNLLIVRKEHVRSIMDLVESLVINKARIEKIRNESIGMGQVMPLEQELRLVAELQEAAKRVGRVDLSGLSERLVEQAQRLEREYAHLVKLSFSGMDSETEYELLEPINMFLGSLLLNHVTGIRPQEERTEASIHVGAITDGQRLTLRVDLSGGGIRLSQATDGTGKVDADLASKTEEEMAALLSLVGIMQEQDRVLQLFHLVHARGGVVHVESRQPGEGVIQLLLPFASTVMKGMMIAVGNQLMIIPSEYVEAIVRRRTLGSETIPSHGLVTHMGRVMPLLDLGSILEIPRVDSPDTVLIVRSNDAYLAVMVEAVVDQADLVVKPKPNIIEDLAEFYGTAILGDGSVALVLDIPSLTSNRG